MGGFDILWLAEKYCSFPLDSEKNLIESSNKACVEVTKLCMVQHQNWKTECLHPNSGQSQFILPHANCEISNLSFVETKPEKMTNFALVMKDLEKRASNLIRSLKMCTDGRILNLELYMNLIISLYESKRELFDFKAVNGETEKVERMLKNPFDILKIYDAAAATLCANNTNNKQYHEIKRSGKVNGRYSMDLLNILLVG